VGDAGELRLQFRILGPLEVLRGEECLLFRGSRERAVLALLVLHANRTVSAERLVEDLWSGNPPEGAIRSVRVYVSRLRQALGAAGEAVLTRRSGYVLQVDCDAVDALRFEELVARGRERAKAGDQAGAAATLWEALALWRGPALADVADAPFARAQAARLEEARLCALEDRIDADLACGRHGELTAELEALTGEHPFRERLWSLRMVALYRSGRQADALRAYQNVRSMLREQLGIEPSSALQQLEGAVLRHDPALDWHRGMTAGRTGPAESGRLPQPLGRQERLPLVAREIELSRLDQVWQATCAGERQLVLLAGEPGIGKSRLAAEFARMVHGAGSLVLFGRCDEGMGVAYQPFVEALSRYLREAPDLVLGRLSGELVRLVREVGERVDGLAPPLQSDPETERYRLFDAVAAWLGAVSESVSVLFVIEDLHWATKPTLLLLSHLLRSDEAPRLLLLGTLRDTPLDMTPDLADLVAELLRIPGVERVRLAGLDEPGVGALMEAQAGHALDDDGWALAKIVHGETAGNPFYVWEMLSLLAEKGDIVRRDGRWVPGLPLAQLDVPDSVRDIVERRLTRLPDRTSEMLALAAVVGERFDLAVLAEATGDSENSVVERLRPAVGARLINETDAGRYQFNHALVRSALEDALGPTRRLQLHRAAGSAIETVHAGHLESQLPQLAHHFVQARDVDKAIEYASRAGDRARAQLAHDEAAGYYRRALELLDVAEEAADKRLRIDLLIALGEAEQRSGEPGYRPALGEAAQRAEQLGDADRLARAALAGYPRWWDRNLPDETRGLGDGDGGEFPYISRLTVDKDRVTALEAALRARGDREDIMLARLLTALAGELMFAAERSRRRELSDQALDMARRLGDAPTLGRALLSRCGAIWDPAMLEERGATAAEFRAVAGELGDPFLKVWASMYSFETAMEAADVEEADRHLEDGQRTALEVGRGLRWFAAFPRVGRVLLAGRLVEADALAKETLEIGLATQPLESVRTHFGLQRFQIRLEQGRLDELVTKLIGAVETGEHPETQAMLAEAYCELGRWDEARVAFEAVTRHLPDLPFDPNWIITITRSASVCAQLGDRSTAAMLYGMLLPYSERLAGQGIVWIGSVAHYLAILARVLGDLSRADAHFADAEATHTRIGAPTWLARTRLEWARMLLTSGHSADAARARDLSGQALETARELGLASVERKAVGLLASQ
jgi:DNA-binding SARP family transcriptional activator